MGSRSEPEAAQTPFRDMPMRQGPPILTASCYCTSCQEAGRQFEELASAPAVLDPDSGSGFILYRKDRVQCVMGQEHLEEHRLKPDSSTRRVVATCCNSAMFLDVTKGHWLSMYRNRFPTGAPPLEMRLMTKERRVGLELAQARNHLGKDRPWGAIGTSHIAPAASKIPACGTQSSGFGAIIRNGYHAVHLRPHLSLPFSH
jgi:hypothetical protein